MLTDRQTSAQTDTTENSTTLAAQVVVIVQSVSADVDLRILALGSLLYQVFVKYRSCM